MTNQPDASGTDGHSKALVAISEVLDRLRRQNEALSVEDGNRRTEVALITQQLDVLTSTVGTLKRVVQDGNGHLPLSTRMYLVEEELRKAFAGLEAIKKDVESDRRARKESDTKTRIALITGLVAIATAIIGAVGKVLSSG